MEEKKSHTAMLDLMLQPGFIVQNNVIQKANQAAQSLLLTPGLDVRELLLTGKEEYASFSGGCLYLTLNLSQQGWGATVTRIDGEDVFLLEPETDQPELHSMALAARELRESLSKVMLAADHLLPALEADEANKEQSARLNRGLYQIQRTLSNMSDASRYASHSRKEACELTGLFSEFFGKAAAFISHTGIRLTYDGPAEKIISMADPEQLERAVLNILSNAVKFTPSEGTIDAKLTRRGKMLQLTVRDSGSGIAENILSSVFHRYLRQSAVEDGRFGLGLGMVLIRSAAANHSGTVLIHQSEGSGTCVTLTMAISQNADPMVRSPRLRVDYAGERDHMLLELSDVLPASAYETDI